MSTLLLQIVSKCLSCTAVSRYLHACRDYTALPPWPAFWFGQRLVAFLDWLKTKLLPPPVLLLSTLPSFTTAPVLYTLSEVGIPEALSQGPQTAAQLAGELGE